MEAEALIEVYKIGGVVLVLLFMLAFGAVTVWRTEIKRHNKLSDRLAEVEGKLVTVLINQVRDNTSEMSALKEATTEQTGVLRQMFTAMRERPCLNSGLHHQQKTPLPHFPSGG